MEALPQDDVAMPILKKAAGLESVVEEAGDTEAIVRYTRMRLNRIACTCRKVAPRAPLSALLAFFEKSLRR